MNKLEVGMYIRTTELYGGLISHITKVCEETKTVMLYGTGVTQYPFKEIEKASHNIIDLIEVGDYVNGYPVAYITNLGKEFGKRISFGDEDCVVASKFNFDKVYIYAEDIKTIVTKEQFSSMKYRLGE